VSPTVPLVRPTSPRADLPPARVVA